MKEVRELLTIPHPVLTVAQHRAKVLENLQKELYNIRRQQGQWHLVATRLLHDS